MSDTRTRILALLLVLLFSCAAPPQLATPTVTLATLEPTVQAPETPAAQTTATVSPTVLATTAPVATPMLEPPAIVYAVDPLEVIEVEPADTTDGVNAHKEHTRIAVRFSFPVVPLDVLNLPDVITQPLTIEPAIAYDGRWLNSFTYVMTPTQDLSVATEYTVKVSKTVDTAGRESQPYQWTFKTMQPAVIETDPRPKGGSRLRNITQPISITFNTAMDHASVEKRLRVLRKSDSWAALGTYEWQDNTVRFTPTYPLDYGTEYVVELKAGARDANRIAAVPAKNLAFRTVKPFALVTTSPRDGDLDSTAIRDEHAGVVLQFTQPVSEKNVLVTVEPKITDQEIFRDGQNYNKGEFYMRIGGGWQASTAYTVTIHGSTRSEYGEMLGRDRVLHFTTAPLEPSVWVHLPAVGLYDLNGPQTVYVSYTNVPRIDFELFEVTRPELFSLLGGDEWDLQARVTAYNPISGSLQLKRKWSLEFPNHVNAEGMISTTLNDALGRKAEAGVYFLRVTAPNVDRTDASLLVVSPYNLALKYTDQDALVWLTDLSSGKPVGNQPITIYNGVGEPLSAGLTGEDGLLGGDLVVQRDDYKKESSVPQLYALSETQDGKIVAITASNWDEGIRNWDFDIDQEEYQYWDRFGINMYTDRSVYRAGQTVYFKGILRRKLEPQPAVPYAWRTETRKDESIETLYGVREVDVQVYNSYYEEISTQTLALNEFGSFHGEIVLNENAPTGEYQIETDYGTLRFNVDEYRRPEFQVNVAADRAQYINGDTIRLDVDTTYFFGGPVTDAQVTWRVLTEEYAPNPNVEGWWDWVDRGTDDGYSYHYSSGADQIREGVGRTDAQGHFEFEVRADIKEYALSQSFTLEAEIEDINHQVVSNRVVVPVHKGEFYIGLRPKSYIGGIGKQEAVDVLTVNSIVTGDMSLERGNQPVTLEIYQGEWSYAREWVDGYWQWNSSYTETLVSKTDIVTDEFGKATVEFTPARGGQYRIKAEGKDTRGNTLTSATWFYVWGEGFVGWKIDNTNRIELITDKKEYLPGDVAEILVPAPFADAEAVFTVERGKVLKAERVSIHGNTARYRVPIVEEYAPNIFVSVMLVKGRGSDSEIPQFKMGYATLKVKPVAQALNVSVRTACLAPLPVASNVSKMPGIVESQTGQDKQIADVPKPTRNCQPRDTATFDIEARDAHNKPVRAEFSVALVDKAIQSLMSDNSSPLLSTFYAERGLAVNTAVTLVQSIEKGNLTVRAQAKGGGGAGVFQVRRNFKDTAYWNPTVVTDETGHASVEVKLPDNLTTWNVTVKGVTMDTRVGEAREDIVSTRPLVVRPVTPRFLVVGDKPRLQAVIHNNTDATLMVKGELSAEGLYVLSGDYYEAMIPPHDKTTVTWPTRMLGAVDQAKVLFTAFGTAVCDLSMDGDYFPAAEQTQKVPEPLPQETECGAKFDDAVELTLPVQYPVTIETVASAEPVASRTVKLLDFKNDALPGEFDRLQIELTPSLAAASNEALKYLESYGWECSEQTVSKFLPNISTYLALERLQLDKDKLHASLQTNVSREIQRLYFLQNSDGGWGWWRDQPSRPALTAYALFALTQAGKAGFGVDEDVARRAREFLVESLNEPTEGKQYNVLNERAFSIWVLGQLGEPMDGRALSLYEQRGKLDHYAKAFLLMTLADKEHAQAQTLLQELTKSAQVTDEFVYWTEGKNDDGLMNTNTRTQAIVVMALARVDPQNALLPKAVKWLMHVRKLGDRFVHWETTQETAWSVMGLTEWMAASGELDGNYAYQVTLNGKLVGDGTVDASNLDETRVLQVSIRDTFADLANELVVSRDSTQGTLYYSAYVRRAPSLGKIPAVSHGMVVQRTYYAVDPLTLNPTKQVIDSTALGDYVQVKLTIGVLGAVNYLAVEDMLPAGFEAVDTSLVTSSRAANSPEIAAEERGAYHPYWWYWGHEEIRDDRVGLFAEWMGRGTYEYTYLMRASVAGTFHALPAKAYAMYDPTIVGQSEGSSFTITR